MPTWDQTLPEAADFTRQNRDAYIAFVQELKAELSRIRHEAGCAGLIYSTYSRSDKQAGEELKQTWKIAKKPHERRSTHPASAVSDIHDIVGLTVVVNFPSDREIVAAYISRPGVLRCALVYQQEEKEENGYHAIHLKVKGATIDRDFLRAEIQIKTMLHDGWGAKTHDLTYKPEGSIDAALLRHMNILGDVLRQLDDQSELIKDVVEIHTKRLTISIRYCYLMAERETAVSVTAAVRSRTLQLTTILRGFVASLVRARPLTTSTIRSRC